MFISEGFSHFVRGWSHQALGHEVYPFLRKINHLLLSAILHFNYSVYFNAVVIATSGQTWKVSSFSPNFGSEVDLDVEIGRTDFVDLSLRPARTVTSSWKKNSPAIYL